MLAEEIASLLLIMFRLYFLLIVTFLKSSCSV